MSDTIQKYVMCLSILLSWPLHAAMCCICFESIVTEPKKKRGYKYLYHKINPEKILPCAHRFHKKCIKKWSKSDNKEHNLCPLCKAEYISISYRSAVPFDVIFMVSTALFSAIYWSLIILKNEYCKKPLTY